MILENLGVQEMNAKELQMVDGGCVLCVWQGINWKQAGDDLINAGQWVLGVFAGISDGISDGLHD